MNTIIDLIKVGPAIQGLELRKHLYQTISDLEKSGKEIIDIYPLNVDIYPFNINKNYIMYIIITKK